MRVVSRETCFVQIKIGFSFSNNAEKLNLQGKSTAQMAYRRYLKRDRFYAETRREDHQN